MNYSLNSIIIDPNPKKLKKNLIILCHGYGGDGKDISIIANYWKNFLPETLFICPNAPEICKITPQGFQWFDLMNQKSDEILSNSLIAEKRLNKFIDEVKNVNNIESDKIALVGFSQGCMIALQTTLKRKDKISCVIGFSGKIINTEHLEKNITSRPEIFLMHGDKDEVVPINFFLEAKDFFAKNNYDIKTKIFKGCEHRIPTEGLSLGLEFLKKNLY